MPPARRRRVGGRLAVVSRRPDPARAPTREPIERWLIVLAGVGLWSILPPYLGPLVGLELDVHASVEIVDHVLPGLAAFAAALVALAQARRGMTESIPALAALGVCVLAGLFQTVSHAALVLAAGGPLQPVDSVVLHASPGPVLLLLSLWLLLAPPTGRQHA